MNELKACPFCGGKVDMKSVVIYSNGERSPASIKCKKCNYCMTAFDNDELIKRWNTRPIEDALRAALAEANEDAARLAGELDAARIYIARRNNIERSLTIDALEAHRARVGAK